MEHQYALFFMCFPMGSVLGGHKVLKPPSPLKSSRCCTLKVVQLGGSGARQGLC